MLKKQFYTLFVLFLLYSVATASTSITRADIAFPSKENVRVYKRKISRDIGIGKIMGYCAVGSALVSLAYISYTFFFKDGKKASTNDVSLTNEQLTKRLIDLEKKYSKKYDPELFSPKWLKKIGKNTLNSSLSTGLGYLAWGRFQKLYNTYNCFDTVDLFVEKRLNDMKLLDQVGKIAESLDYSYENSGSNVLKNKNRFIVAYKNIVSGVEVIVAFMEYKIESYRAKGVLISQEELLLPNNLFDYTNDVCRTVRLELENYSSNSDFYVIINDYVLYIRSMIKIFSGLESRVCWQRG